MYYFEQKYHLILINNMFIYLSIIFIYTNFSTELEIIQALRLCFSDFKITHIPKMQNEIADSLARNARSFHKYLCFIDCSIPVLLSKPPQV